VNLYAEAGTRSTRTPPTAATQLTELAAATATAELRHYGEASLDPPPARAVVPFGGQARSVIDQAIGVISCIQQSAGGRVRRAAHRLTEPEHPAPAGRADLVDKTINPTTTQA